MADNLNGSIRRLTKPARSRLLKTLSRTQVLILDNFGPSILNAAEGLDLLEIIEDRHGRASTIVTSQIPVDSWLQVIADPTLGDATLDRLVHNAHRLQLTGESMRKKAAKAAILDEPATASTDEYVGQWVPAIP